ncbi:MAG: site-specific integrase [Leptolyngbya sp. SIOISBB]|nr:site-specific integrase [Leptolyngbya sp. SIOISBB]
MDFQLKLKQINDLLRESRVKVAIGQTGDRLVLRATLPPKPDSSKTIPYQQRISTGLPANPAGLREAEKRARLLGAQLPAREFDWEQWGYKTAIAKLSCADWIDRFQKDYISKGGKLDTWEGDYLKIYRRLPPESPLSGALLETMVKGTKDNTRSRQRAAMAATALARFAGLDWSADHLRGNYSPSKVAVRDIPTDRAIAQFREAIANPAWQWVYGVMACYGLRNHEVFYLDLTDFPVIRVLEDTKTGSREVWPCYPEWATNWALCDRQLPPVKLDRPNQKIGHSVTKYLSPKLPFVPYDLRHAWAVRTLLYRWPVELSARQMGHSVEVHTRTYQRWITREQTQQVYDLLVNRSDRPRPPKAED